MKDCPHGGEKEWQAYKGGGKKNDDGRGCQIDAKNTMGGSKKKM